MYEYDELKIYRGKDIQINKNIIIMQPSIDQIQEFGEEHYFHAVHNLTSVGADLKWQLWDMGIDYTTISDYDLFIKLISQLVSSKKYLYNALKENPEKYEKEIEMLGDRDWNELLINPMQLTMKYVHDKNFDDDTFDFADFMPFKHEESNQIILYNPIRDISIDRLGYQKIVEVVRDIHGFKRNNQLPANEKTKMDLIEDARDEAMAALNKPYKSVLKPLVSSLSAKCGQCGDERIWNMKVNMFFDSIKRLNKIQDAELLLQGAYSGFANLKGIDKSRLDWTGDI